MNKLQAVEQFRRAIQIFAQTLTDEEAIEITTVFPAFKTGKLYRENEKFIYGINGVGDLQLYKVIEEHISPEDCIPSESPSLYTPLGVNAEGYPLWSKTTGFNDAYNVGDIVDYNGVLYKSLIEGNVYSPDECPTGWEIYQE